MHSSKEKLTNLHRHRFSLCSSLTESYNVHACSLKPHSLLAVSDLPVYYLRILVQGVASSRREEEHRVSE